MLTSIYKVKKFSLHVLLTYYRFISSFAITLKKLRANSYYAREDTNKLGKRVSVFFSPKQHNSFLFKRNKLMFFILTRRMPLESALQITALLAARGHILIFLEKTLVTTGRLPRILRNKIMFLISTSCIWFEFHLQISRCRSPLATLFFSLTPRSFHRVVPGNKDFPRRNYISFAAVSRCKLFRNSHLNVSYNIAKYSFFFDAHNALSS